MNLFQPTPPPYDPLKWLEQPLDVRARAVCEAWALQGYGTPIAVYAIYIVKLIAYIAGWLYFCHFTPGLGSLATIESWWLAPVAFQKAILWSLLFEGLGLGCGSGPLTGRYNPPIGGVLYFARPGTTKLPLFEKVPLFGGVTRTWLDVALYLGLVAALLFALVSPYVRAENMFAIVLSVGLLGLSDRTVFLACRSEHYWTTCVCFLFADDWIPGAKAVQLALWFWAGFSKLNHHFPAVVCVMMSNSPFTRFAWMRRLMYRHYPEDLRPSRVAVAAAHAGTVLELTVPLFMLLSPGGTSLVIGLVLMLMLHGFITSNIPMGVPIEWNAMVVYGAFALFWAHPEANPLHPGSVGLGAFLLLMLVAVPLLGNLFPNRVSFLLAMRYYAGNWACSVWLLRAESYRKLSRLTTSAPWITDQLAPLYDSSTTVGLLGRVMAFRFMHLHGRALPLLIPRAIDRLQDYEYFDGEIMAGFVLGWNFGDGHLHHEQLLEAIQTQCAFEPGELRCIFIESEPLHLRTLDYRIVDAAQGELEHGELDVSRLRECQPWVSMPEAIRQG